MTSWFTPLLLVSCAAVFLHAEDEEWYDEEADWEQLAGDTAQEGWVVDASDESMSQATPSSSQSKYIYPSQDSQGEMFASAQPSFRAKKWGVFATGEWLFWKAEEESLDYGIQSPNFTNAGPFALSSSTQGIRGKISNINPEYQSGFRVGVVGILPHDKWDISLFWTSYVNRAHDSISPKLPKVVFPVYLNANTIPIALSAKAHWKLDFNVFDLELGRSFFVGNHLSVRPFLAFQAAWIEQHLNIHYDDLTLTYGMFNSPSSTTTPKITSLNHSEFSGYGLRAGLNTKWPLAWGLSLLGNLSYSLLCSDFDLHQNEKNADGSYRTKLKDDLDLTSQVFQLFGGISWERQFENSRYYLNLHAGWEQQVWFDQNQFNLFLNQPLSRSNVGDTINQQGNLTLSGLTLGATFGF
jgi:hypothetical protein